MTENFIVMIEQPLLMNIMKLADCKLKAKAVREIMEWCPEEKVAKLYNAMADFTISLTNF
jgi:hypothetical protein